MDKGSFLWLLMVCALTALVVYNALFDVPAFTALTRFLALGAFVALCVSLIIGPLAIISPKDFTSLLVHRRAIGLASFAFVLGHSTISFFIGFGGDLSALLKHASAPYAIGALAIYIVLAATSTDWATKNIMQWKNIQRLTYVAFILSFIHFIDKANGLFAKIEGQTFANLSEIATVMLGIATVVLQFYGFYKVKKRQAAAKALAKPPVPSASKPLIPSTPKTQAAEKVPNEDIIASIRKDEGES